MKMMVVEDEDILRNGICNVGKWENYGIEISGKAKNGIEALEMIHENTPDIVLTDVVMPFMDGIELTKMLYERYPKVKVIILSGHEQFQYVKSAIDYKASHYLLKPAKIERIIEVVCGLKVEIEEERAKELETSVLREKLKESMPVLREHYLKQMVLTGVRDVSEIAGQLSFYDIHIEINHVAVMNLKYDDTMGTIEERSLRGLSLRELCDEILRNEFQYAIFQNDIDQLVIIVNYSENISTKDALNYIVGKGLRIQKELEQINGKSISIGISRLKSSITQIDKAYYEAEMALSYKFFMGDNSIIYIGDVDSGGENNPYFLEQIRSEILMHLRSGNKKQTIGDIEKYFSELEGYTNRGSAFVKDELVILVHDIFRSLLANGSRDAKLTTSQEEILNDIGLYKDVTLSYMEERFKKMINELIEQIMNSRQIMNKGIVEDAMIYVQNNLDKDISLISVADKVHISPNYLSYLFKENGEKFKDFTIRIKMEKATELLDDGRYNHNQIAYKLGYNDGRYFYQVYKKYQAKLKNT